MNETNGTLDFAVVKDLRSALIELIKRKTRKTNKRSFRRPKSHQFYPKGGRDKRPITYKRKREREGYLLPEQLEAEPTEEHVEHPLTIRDGMIIKQTIVNPDITNLLEHGLSEDDIYSALKVYGLHVVSVAGRVVKERRAPYNQTKQLIELIAKAGAIPARELVLDKKLKPSFLMEGHYNYKVDRNTLFIPKDINYPFEIITSLMRSGDPTIKLQKMGYVPAHIVEIKGVPFVAVYKYKPQ